MFVLLVAVTFSIIYFGFGTVSKRSEDVLASQVLEDPDGLRLPEGYENKAVRGLSVSKRSVLDSLMGMVRVSDESDLGEYLKPVSSFWAQEREWVMSAHYALKVVEVDPSEEASEIAAHTCAIAIKNSDQADEALKLSLRDAAIYHYDKVLAVDEQNITAQINKALLWVDVPPAEQPMKGVLSLLALQKKYPEEPAVLYHLGRLGMSTGQWDKARVRLEQANELAPNDTKIVCLLAELYRNTNEAVLAKEFSEQCNKLN